MSSYTVSAFDYPLPAHLIAQHPLPDRSASRLLVLHRSSGQIEHKRFRDLPSLIAPGDVLVVNASRVIPARLKATRDNGREAEVLLVHAEADGTWLAMVHPGGKLKPGRRVRFGDGGTADVVEVLGGGLRRLKFSAGLDVRALMERHGAVPLPPYITRPPGPKTATGTRRSSRALTAAWPPPRLGCTSLRRSCERSSGRERGSSRSCCT